MSLSKKRENADEDSGTNRRAVLRISGGYGKSNVDAVLVSVKSFAELRRAYPNYFADTHVLTNFLHHLLG
jgi:hypothetical protein